MLCFYRRVHTLLTKKKIFPTRRWYLTCAISDPFVRPPFKDRVGYSSKRFSSTSHDHDDPNEQKDSSSVSTEELEKFKSLAPEWWENDGEYIALRSLNKLRVSLILDLVCGSSRVSSHPLRGVNILDVGCGGGILAEPLARLGANVTGIDPLQENIDAAIAHRGEHSDLASLSYTCTTVEDFCRVHSDCFDVVVASEVLEHVENVDVFVQDCCSCVKGGGKFLVTTINRNVVSTLLVKYAAEYLFRIVPAGTHNEDKFVAPDELVDMLRTGGDMVGINFKGMIMNPLTYKWSWTPSLAMNYACFSTKPT